MDNNIGSRSAFICFSDFAHRKKKFHNPIRVNFYSEDSLRKEIENAAKRIKRINHSINPIASAV